MVELIDLSLLFHVPKPNGSVKARGPSGLSIWQDAHRRDAVCVVAQKEAFLALRLPPVVAPFPAAQVLGNTMARTLTERGRVGWTLPVEQFSSTAEILLRQGFLRQRHFGRVRGPLRLPPRGAFGFASLINAIDRNGRADDDDQEQD